MKRADLEKLCKDELIDIILVLQEQIQTMALKIAELEARLNMNSKNSSIPPSSDLWRKPQQQRQKTGKKPGGQPGHKGHGLKITKEPNKTIQLKPTICKHCNNTDFKNTNNNTIIDCRYKIDIKIQTELTRYDQIETICPVCKTTNLGQYPKDITSKIQYGEGVKAVSVLFTHYAMVSYDKTQKILNDVFDVPIGVGTIVNHVAEFVHKSESVLCEIQSQLKDASVLHLDETGVYVGGGIQWLHTASTGEATYVTVHPNRGQVGMDDNGVLKEFRGTAVHDCWKPYFKYEHCKHGLCNAHLLRELQGVVENTGQVWAGLMMDFLRESKRVVDRYKEANQDVLPVDYREGFAEQYIQILLLGERENPLVVGVRKRSKTRCLLDRFVDYPGEVLRFMNDFRVPFDNNLAERDIRNVKVKQKVSGGFRCAEGAKNFGKISSIIGTALKQKTSAFNAVSGIITGTTTSLFQNTPD
jgi:transposase-like protein